MTRLRPGNGRRRLAFAVALSAVLSSSCFGAEFARAFALYFGLQLHSLSPWSPDGERLLFHPLAGGLWSVPLDGTPPVLLTDDRVNSASFSPDGTQVAYSTTASKEGEQLHHGGLWVVKSDASGRTQIAISFESYCLVLGWSLDGKWIACGAGDGIELVRPDCSERRPLDVYALTAWSPDGEHVARIPKQGSSAIPQIEETRTRESRPVRLMEGLLPSWSPDGRTLAFADTRVSDPSGTFLMDSDGANRRLLCEGVLPRWSPSGESILVQRYDRELGFHLVTVAPDGSVEHVLAREASFGYWSPDGRHVAFWREPDLFVIDADGTNERKVAEPELRAGS